MAHQIDKRNFEFRRLNNEAAEALRANSFNILSAVKGASDIRVDNFTGSASRLAAKVDAEDARPRWVKAVELARAPSLAVAGFAAAEAEPAEFVPLPDEQMISGSSVVHLLQTRFGIPVFASGRTVQFSGGTAEISGTAVEAMDEVENELVLADAREAIGRAAEYVVRPAEAKGEGWGASPAVPELDLTGFSPQQTALFALPARPGVFSGSPFVGPIKVQLTYFYQGPAVRLAWQVELTVPDEQGEPAYDYVVMVAAGPYEPGEILYVQDRVCRLRGACALHVHNPAQTPATSVDLPRSGADYPATLQPFVDGGDWLDGNGTSGNTVACKGNNGILQGTAAGNVVQFAPANPMENWIAHTFYFCNVMIDFFRTLGFDEAAGNFQKRHLTGAPGSGDPVDARVYHQGFAGVASMATPADGQSPIMKMGLYPQTGHHSALDSDVVFHEFVHGVSNRLVGGRLNHLALSDPQSRGMGEGWSDYFAVTFQNAARGVDRSVSGDWLTGNSTGIRGFAYTDTFPDSYGDLGMGRYQGPHPIGEIWCATLMKATRDLIAALADRPRGFAIAWQAVFDGMRLSPANPSFLDARDAILSAIGNLSRRGHITTHEERDALRGFWGAFAHFGMGANAASPSSGLAGIREDRTIPQIP